MTGLDFSAPAIAAARDIAAHAGIEAEFLQANVYDAVPGAAGPNLRHRLHRTWSAQRLPDIERWAITMANLLAPGGRFYLAESHPVTDVFAEYDLSIDSS